MQAARKSAAAGRGRVIDRGKLLRFSFEGRRYTGFAGDTIASALAANGVASFRGLSSIIGRAGS